MRRIGAIVLLLGAGLALGGGAQAKTTHKQLKCKAGYARRTVRIPKRVHGVIARRHGRIVYIKVQRCVKTRKPAKPKPSTSPPSTSTTPTAPSSPGSSTVPSPSPTSPTPPPPSGAPVNTALPTVSGTAMNGNTLTGSTGSWSNAPTSYAYQWQRCNTGGCQNIGGATGSQYVLVGTDVGSTVRVSVTAHNAPGSATATSAQTGIVSSSGGSGGGSGGDPVVVAVGDIARPSNCGATCPQALTAALAQTFSPTAVLVLGDNQYDNGTSAEYAGSYDLTWGHDFNSIVHPIPGNHEYGTSGAQGYFNYFGHAANLDNTPNGYYSFNLGTWHIVGLNSDCSDAGCANANDGTTSTAQNTWLQGDLASNPSACTLAMWHHPLFSAGWMSGSSGVAPLWNALYNAHADVVLGGHDHIYERYAQQDALGTGTPNGIREFVVGTGGESLNGIQKPRQPTLQFSDEAYGVLVLTLHANSYSWKFVTTGSATPVDSGTATCHGPGAAPATVATTRVTNAARLARLNEPELVFDAHPLRASVYAMLHGGIPVAIHCSRGCDVHATISLRDGGRVRRIASAHETDEQIPHPYSRILLHLPASGLTRLAGRTLVVRFVANDADRHRRTVTRTLRLR